LAFSNGMIVNPRQSGSKHTFDTMLTIRFTAEHTLPQGSNNLYEYRYAIDKLHQKILRINEDTNHNNVIFSPIDEEDQSRLIAVANKLVTDGGYPK